MAVLFKLASALKHCFDVARFENFNGCMTFTTLMFELYSNILFSYHGLHVYFVVEQHFQEKQEYATRKLLSIHSQILHSLRDLDISFALFYA